MKVRLVFETDVDDKAIGTKNDALIVAIRELESALKEADSADDLGEIFTMSVKES